MPQSWQLYIGYLYVKIIEFVEILYKLNVNTIVMNFSTAEVQFFVPFKAFCIEFSISAVTLP